MTVTFEEFSSTHDFFDYTSCAFNLRKLYLLNSNYADLSFLFTILPGEKSRSV